MNDDKELTMDEMIPAEHWDKIKEITKTLAVQVKDLQDALNDFNGFAR